MLPPGSLNFSFKSYLKIYSAPLRTRYEQESQMTSPKLIRLFAGIFLLGVSANLACAQVTGTISGKVEDSSGAAVGGAIVAVKNLETGAVRTVTTDETGIFRVLALPVGSQEVRAEKPGFRAAVRTGI